MEAQNVYGIKKSMSQQASEFVSSNDMVTNVVFILILLVVGVLLFNYIISLMLYFKYPGNSPHLIDGMVDTKDAEMKITQNPHDSSAKTIFDIFSNSSNEIPTFNIDSYFFLNSW